MFKNPIPIMLLLIFLSVYILFTGCKEIEVASKPIQVKSIARNAVQLLDSTLDIKVIYVFDDSGDLNNIKLFKKEANFINEQKYITIYKDYFSKKAKFLFTENYNDSTYMNYYVDHVQRTCYRTCFVSGIAQFVEVSVMQRIQLPDSSIQRIQKLFSSIDYKLIFNPPMYHIPIWRQHG